MRHHAKFISCRSVKPLLSYGIFTAVTFRDLVTLTFALLTLDSGYTWQVMCLTPPPSLKTLSLFVLELWVMTSPIGHHRRCVCSHWACAVSRDLCVGGQHFPCIWNPWPRFVSSLCNVLGFTINTKRVIRQQCHALFTTHRACAKSRDLWMGGGSKQLHIWNPRPHFAYSLYNIY